MFKNMRIGVRLGLGFGLLVLLMIVMASIAITRLSQLNDNIEMISNDRYPKTVLANTAINNINIIARTARNIVLLDNPQEIAAEHERLQTAGSNLGEVIEELIPTNTSETGRKLMKTIVDTRQLFLVARDKYLALANEGKREEAIAFLVSDMRVRQAALIDVLDQLLVFQSGLMQEANDEATVNYDKARNIMITITILVLLIATSIAFWVTRSITRPLNVAVGVANQLAEGDMTARIEVNSTDETGQLLSAMQNMVEKLSQIIGEVRGAADNLTSASEEVSSTAQSMSQASSEQAASVEETSASIEQMSASINQNAENAKITDGMASQAARQATEGGEAVKSTVTAMNQIASKIGIIDDIAYQTNLLALNAAIEAARAGEHGKGFAVVAAEVRKLAERSQVAAREIGEVASSSVELAERAGMLLDEIVPAINKTSDLVQEITAASSEQSAGAAQVNSAINQLNQITQQNASSSEELAATSEEMSGQAEQLQQTMAFFRVENNSATSTNKPKNTTKVVATKGKNKSNSHVKHDDELEFVRF
jgi:methyl-accepting chemotaxis protein